MGRHEMHAFGQILRHGLDHRGLHRADIGEDRALLQMIGDLSCDRAAGPHRHAKDDVVGVAHGVGRHLRDLVAETDFARPRPHRFAAIIDDDAAGEIELLGGMRDR